MYGIPVLVILISSWQGLGSFLGNYFLAKVSLGLVDRLRRALFESLLRLPNTYFDQHNSGHLISRINYDATMVTGAATEAVKVVIREGFIVIALFGYLLWDELEADPGHGGDPADHRRDGRQGEQAVPQTEPQDPGINGRRHPCGIGDHPGLPGGAQLRRRRLRIRAFR